MADTPKFGTPAGHEPTRPSVTSFSSFSPSTPPADALQRGLALLLSTVATDLDNLRELIQQAEPGDPAVQAVLGDLLAVSAWRCDEGARLADPDLPLRRTQAEHFFAPALLCALGLRHA